LSWLVLGWVVLGWTAACSAPPPPSAAARIELAVAALRAGEFEAARDLVATAKALAPGDVAVAEWNSAVAEAAWQDDAAIAEQQRAVRITARNERESVPSAGLQQAALQGRLGDLLFAAGRWGEATLWLEAGAIGDEAVRRRAFAEVSRRLPFQRTTTGPFLTEQALLDGGGPELAVGVGEVLRSLAIDTGTSMTTLSRTLATELGVQARTPAGTALDGTGRAVAVEVGILDGMMIGAVGVGAWPVLVVADDALALRDLHGGPSRTPAGVVGLDLLSAFRLSIDPERSSIVVERPIGLAESESVQCVRLEGRCLVPVVVEGVRLWFVMDTGASHSSLTVEGLAALPGGQSRAQPAFRRVRTLGGGTFAVREVVDLVLRVGVARFQGVRLPVVDRKQSEFFPVHGVLGFDLLSRCRMTLDRGRARITAVAETG
jgi:predicted aspartyl protease